MSYQYTLTNEQHAFIQQLISDKRVVVPLADARVPLQVYDLVMSAKPVEEPRPLPVSGV